MQQASFADLGLAPEVKLVTAIDVWTGSVTKGVASPFTAQAVPPHAALFVTLSLQQ
jgi:hypothetical protein